jgi:cytochrome d ubiquinol oxidase subunit II
VDLPTLWFIIVVYLLAGFLFLEGFDFGVGMLSPFLSKEDEHRRMVLSSIGGVWDGNEVWMVSGGAVLFAAFPNWYATLFSSLFPVFTLILCGLILRGIGIKFRNLKPAASWRNNWDWLIAGGSFAAAFFWGVVVGNLLQGIPFNKDLVFVGNSSDIFTPFSLAVGAVFVLMFILHGAVYLSIKLSGEILARLQRILLPVFLAALAGAASFLLIGFFKLGMLRSGLELLFGGLAVILLLTCGIMLKRSPLASFWASGITIICVGGLVFAHLYPRVLISTIDPSLNLTITNASSSPYSLKIMSIVALFFIPTTLFYQAWTYWTFRKRIEKSDLSY